jgi:hypothetical protein
LHDTQLADRQSAADVIRNGSSLSSQRSVEANGNNSDASLQVDANKLDQDLGVGPASPTTQALQDYHHAAAKDLQERKEAAEERRRNKSMEKLPAPSSSDVEGQRVLTEAFCINRLDSIRQVVGSTKLGIFADGKDNSARAEQIAQFFGEFMRQNAEDDSPYFCVSAPILGRLMHTFRDDYLSRGTAAAVDFDLTQHVDEIVEKAKESMLEDSSAIRLHTKKPSLTSSKLFFQMLTHDWKRTLQHNKHISQRNSLESVMLLGSTVLRTKRHWMDIFRRFWKALSLRIL